MNEYINPQRIVTEHNVENSGNILGNNTVQAVFNDRNCIKIKSGGYILLDFGRELNGGVVVTIQSVSAGDTKLRIVFGESVSESLSDLCKKNSRKLLTL